MHYLQLLLNDDLDYAVTEEDIQTVKKILFTNFEFFNHPKSIDVVEDLILDWEKEHSKEMFEALVNFIELEAKHKDNTEVRLKVALIKGDIQTVESLLKNGARLEGPEWRDHSPAAFTFCRTNINARKEIWMLLLEYGLDTTFKNQYGENLLFELVSFREENFADSVEIAEKLIECGVSVNELNSGRQSVLYRCIEIGKKQWARFLIDKGANTELKYENDRMALHEACMNNDESIISLLIKEGADVSAVSQLDETPLFLLDFEKDNYDSCVKVLIKEISKLTFKNLQISEIDMKLIRANSETKYYFEQCMKELDEMKKTKFYGPHTYFSVFEKKNLNKLAHLTKNENFVLKFRDNVNKFYYYENDLKNILEEAVELRNEKKIAYLRLCSIFGEFFPDTVIRNLLKNLTLKDLPVT